MRTPKYRATLWIMANVFWFSSLPAFWSYLNRELSAGTFAPDGDSIGIPFTGAAILALVVAPALNAVWWWLSRRYPGSVSLFAASKRSLVGHVLAALTALLVIGAAWELIAGAPEITAVVVAWCYVVLAFRAAYVHTHARSEVAT